MSFDEKPYDIKKRCFHFSGQLIKFIKGTQYD